MIAYLFWHWPAEPLDAAGTEDYEARQAAFHRALADAGAEGFVESHSYRVRGAAWLPSAEAYEDWYLLDGSFALDPLNDAAVGTIAGPAHRRATLGAVGAGGLYRLHHGVPGAASGTVSWLAKERTRSYDDFYALIPETVATWRRMNVLGPAPEFMVEGSPPAGLEATAVERELLI